MTWTPVTGPNIRHSSSVTKHQTPCTDDGGLQHSLGRARPLERSRSRCSATQRTNDDGTFITKEGEGLINQVRVPPWKGLGLCLRVTNKGESRFGKANDRVEAKEHLPSGIPVQVWWGALSVEGRKLDLCSKVIIGFPVSIPSALVKR